MSDITLTSGIRQNLLSLQQTSAELTTTQEALATGKSVNSAAENPSAYFTSQNLTNTANSLSSLLDQIGQGQQTIDAATNGLTGITSLLQQALSTVQQAQSDSWTTAASTTGTASLGGTAATTGSASLGGTAASTGTVELAGFTGGAVTGSAAIGSSGTLTAADTLVIDVGSSTYSVTLASGDTISNVLTSINDASGLSGAITATSNGSGDLVLTAISGTPSFNVVSGTAALNLAAGTVSSTFSSTAATSLSAGTLSISIGTGTYDVTYAASASLSTIESDINGTVGLSGVVTATDDGQGHLILQSSGNFTVDAGSAATALGLSTGAVTLNGGANTNAAGNLLINVGSSTYSVSIASGATLAQIENDINNTTGLGSSGAVAATDDGNGHLILKSSQNFSVSSSTLATDLGLGTAAVTLNGAANSNSAGTLSIAVGSTTYNVSIGSDATLAAIENDINNTTGLGSSGAVTATDDGDGHLVLTSNSAPTGFTVVANSLSSTLGVTASATASNSPIGSSTTRTTLQENYNGLLDQINELAADSGYNGVNLLGGDNLTINFNSNGTSSLTIQGVTFNAQGLYLDSVSASSGSGSFQDNSALSSLVTDLNTAIGNVQSQTETFGTNSGVIGTRQTFTTAMINTLQTGASNLVAADQNEESADLLTEQTQQQLEISALSIANQANQSVLKLFP